jgi:hypothetical protein
MRCRARLESSSCFPPDVSGLLHRLRFREFVHYCPLHRPCPVSVELRLAAIARCAWARATLIACATARSAKRIIQPKTLGAPSGIHPKACGEFPEVESTAGCLPWHKKEVPIVVLTASIEAPASIRLRMSLRRLLDDLRNHVELFHQAPDIDEDRKDGADVGVWHIGDALIV